MGEVRGDPEEMEQLSLNDPEMDDNEESLP